MKLRLTDQVVRNFLKCLGNDHLTTDELKKKYESRYGKPINVVPVIDFLLEENEIQIFAKNHEIAYIGTPRIRWENTAASEK